MPKVCTPLRRSSGSRTKLHAAARRVPRWSAILRRSDKARASAFQPRWFIRSDALQTADVAGLGRGTPVIDLVVADAHAHDTRRASGKLGKMSAVTACQQHHRSRRRRRSRDPRCDRSGFDVGPTPRARVGTRTRPARPLSLSCQLLRKSTVLTMARTSHSVTRCILLESAGLVIAVSRGRRRRPEDPRCPTPTAPTSNRGNGPGNGLAWSARCVPAAYRLRPGKTGALRRGAVASFRSPRDQRAARRRQSRLAARLWAVQRPRQRAASKLLARHAVRRRSTCPPSQLSSIPTTAPRRGRGTDRIHVAGLRAQLGAALRGPNAT